MRPYVLNQSALELRASGGETIEEEDARQRIADLKALRLQVEAAIATLEEAPKIITLHPVTLDRYVETVDALATRVAEHDEAEDDRGPLVKAFRALAHSVTVHPNGPREVLPGRGQGETGCSDRRRRLPSSGL